MSNRQQIAGFVPIDENLVDENQIVSRRGLTWWICVARSAFYRRRAARRSFVFLRSWIPSVVGKGTHIVLTSWLGQALTSQTADFSAGISRRSDMMTCSSGRHHLMLAEQTKSAIQSAYSRLLEEKGYRPRRCQKQMIAEIANTLGNIPDGNNICVVEAGTGTGKTIAYALAAIPVAQALDKKIVISTATIALQEQIVLQDLPDIREHANLSFSFALAKGRRRYLCLSKLDSVLQGDAGSGLIGSLFEEPAGVDDSAVFQQMLDALGKGRWDGEMDSWKEELASSTWARVSTDHSGCTQRQCSHYDNCYFYRAREEIHRVDCIVTNHDLVLADLMMGGGAVLPEPEDTIYILDEGHHLPEKAGNHFAHFQAIYSTLAWLGQLPTAVAIATELIEVDTSVFAALENNIERISERLNDIAAQLQVFRASAEEIDNGWRYRFELGRIPEEIAVTAGELARDFDQMRVPVERLSDAVEVRLEDASSLEREPLELGLAALGVASDRLAAATALWFNYSLTNPQPPYARWLTFTQQGAVEGMEIQLSAHPVSVAEELQERLWSRCAGAIVTSATMSVAGDFSRLQDRSGIGSENRFVSLQSPFNYFEQAQLVIPSMETDPGDADAHGAELADLLPALIGSDLGSLVLFTSWRQMLRVYDDIDPEFQALILKQGDLSRTQILKEHRNRVAQQQQSCIFGLASFAEGVDLPGDECSHVVITKIPFAVPDDPVGATQSEWIESSGGNAFQQVMLPDAVLRVVQAAGRLMRTETDGGRVTILDRRIVTRRYGRLILDSLPPFRREIQ